MVFRRGNRSQLRPINSVKNIVQEISAVAAAAQATTVIAQAVDAPTLAATTEVEKACRINQIYIEVWIYGAAADNVNSPITWMLFQNPSNAFTTPAPSTVGASDLKRYVIAMGKGLVGNQAVGNPPYLIRGWFAVPKVRRRMGQDDTINFVLINNTAGVINTCKLFIYKWYK